MAMDPTSKNREALKSIVPSSTPLGQSFDKSKKETEDQLAVDEANNLVMAREEIPLPAEAQAFARPVISGRAPGDLGMGEEFINPSAPTPAAAPVTTSAAPQAAAPAPSPGIPDQSAEMNKGFNAYEQAASDTQAQIDKLNQEKAAAIQKNIEDDEKAVEQINPTDIFAGKATWQKILGGIGMFLGSITPEGARNVASFIDKEIERDQNLQRTNIKLRQDKKDKHFQNLMQKFGSEETALLAKKKDAYTVLGLHMQKLELASRNAETRARMAQGREQIELQKQQLNQQLFAAVQKQAEKQQEGAVAGYSGSIKDPVAARDFRTQVAEVPGVLSEIKNLKDINNKFMGGALSPEARASAQQSQTLLIGKMRTALIGPGTVNESEYKLLRDAISNPTDFFSLGSSNKLKLEKLEAAYKNKMDANAKAYGLQKIMPQGARKIE